MSHSHQFAFPLKYLHELQSFPSFPILRILVQKKTPRCFHGGVFFFFFSGPMKGRGEAILACALRGDAAAVVDPDAVADFDVVVVVEDLEFTADCIPGVGALVAA